MKVCVMGAGAIGGYFGGRLAKSGMDVIFIARGEHLKAMKESGLKVRSKVHENFSISVNATDAPDDIGLVDLVLFTVKAHDTEEAAKDIKPLVGEDTTILSLQNGIDNEEILAQMYGEDKVVGGVAYILANVDEPGVILHETLGRVEIGEISGKITNRIKEIKNVFEEADIRCDISKNIEKVLWRKLAFNCALNAMTALTKSPLNEIIDIEESLDVFEAAIRETIRVGVAYGVEMDENDIVENLMDVAENAGDMESSMLNDLRKNKKLEIDPLNGKVVELGKKLDTDTPVNKTLYGCLKVINNKFGR
ncbi:MAG: ketopantoate reductase family protein [Thermoplasmatota archaeon]